MTTCPNPKPYRIRTSNSPAAINAARSAGQPGSRRTHRPRLLSIGMSVATTSEFGSALRTWRTRRRFSQVDLAVEAGTTQRHLSLPEQVD